MTIKDIKWKEITEDEAKEIGADQWEEVVDAEPLEEEWIVEEQEAGYMLEGEAKIVVGDEELVLKPGMLFSFPKGLKCIWITPKYMKKVFKVNFDF